MFLKDYPKTPLLCRIWQQYFRRKPSENRVASFALLKFERVISLFFLDNPPHHNHVNETLFIKYNPGIEISWQYPPGNPHCDGRTGVRTVALLTVIGVLIVVNPSKIKAEIRSRGTE